MRYLVESTTLFPQRLNHAFSEYSQLRQTNLLETSCKNPQTADFIKTEPQETTIQQDPMVDQVHLPHHPVSSMSSQLSEEYSSTVDSQKQSESLSQQLATPNSSKKPKLSSKSSSLVKPKKPSKKKAKELEMRSLKCFLCNKVIGIDHLSEHLLFGDVHCTICNTSFRNCDDFQEWTLGHKLQHTTCNHVLQYTEDPVQSMDFHLSNQYLENGVSSKSWLRDKNIHLRAYMFGMNSLKSSPPWMEAISKFATSLSVSENRGHVKKSAISSTKKKTVKHPNQKIKSESQNNGNSHAFVDNLNDSYNESINSELNGSQSVSSYSNISDPTIECPVYPQDTQITSSETDISAEYSSLNNQESLGMPSLEAPGNVSPYKPSVKDSSSLSKKAKQLKQEQKKRKKSEWLSGITKKKVATTPKGKKKVTGYLETPVDGFYYIVQHAIKECPNCYAAVTPPDYAMNIVTFLMTAICRDCGLTIYVVHDPPDDSGPRVCIVQGGKGKRGRKKLLKNDNAI